MLGPRAAEEGDHASADLLLAGDGLLFGVDLRDGGAAGGGLLRGEGVELIGEGLAAGVVDSGLGRGCGLGVEAGGQQEDHEEAHARKDSSCLTGWAGCGC